jgi:hypothetical protein
MAALPVTHLTALGNDANLELLPCNVLLGTTLIQAITTAPYAAAFTPHGSTATAIQLPHHAKVVTSSTGAITAAFAVEFIHHG